MRLNPPDWWYGSDTEFRRNRYISQLLSPFGYLYGHAVTLRWRLTKPYRSGLPVICVGNLTMGGAGKTPTAIAIADRLIRDGLKPYFLSRGYGGRRRGPYLVDPDLDTAQDVGDEPLLLAQTAPTVIAKQRAEGARLIDRKDADLIILDDGFQNPTIQKDFSLIVIDAEAGIGNSKTFPAGPLRAPLAFQLRHTHAILSVGYDMSEKTALALLNLAPKKLFLRAHLESSTDARALIGKKAIAYCGIGRPEKFFKTLQKIGVKPIEKFAFSDHHPYSDEDAATLLKSAKETSLPLVTTEKDLARLKGTTGVTKKLAKKSLALPVKLVFREGDEDNLIGEIGKYIFKAPA